MNKIPYYNPNYVWDYSPIAGGIDCSSYTACQNLEIENCPWQCRYGKVSQDYIIDGMGVYVTRNNDSYLYGQMELSENICYENGINGGKCDDRAMSRVCVTQRGSHSSCIISWLSQDGPWND